MATKIVGNGQGQLVLDGSVLEIGESIEVYAGHAWWDAKVIYTQVGWRIYLAAAKPIATLHGLGMVARRVPAE